MGQGVLSRISRSFDLAEGRPARAQAVPVFVVVIRQQIHR